MLKNKQRLITAGVTLAAIAGAAHLMQSNRGSQGAVSTASVVPVSAASAAGVAITPPTMPTKNDVTVVAAKVAPAPAPAPAPEARPPADIAGALPVPPRDALMPAPLPNAGGALRGRMAAISPTPVEPAAEEPQRNEFGLTCGPILSASVGDVAMVRLTLTAPCRGGEQVTVHHGALTFSGMLDNFGTYSVAVPALAADAEFSIGFADGVAVQTNIQVPLAAETERAVLMYQGAAGLQIHALEFGADYDEDGHVWAGAPRDAASALKSGGGFMTVLGDTGAADSLRAQIYTFPGTSYLQSGVVRLSVEAEITAGNCGTEVAGQSIEPSFGGEANSVALTVSIPDCSAVGEYLVLKNLLRDLKIASN